MKAGCKLVAFVVLFFQGGDYMGYIPALEKIENLVASQLLKNGNKSADALECIKFMREMKKLSQKDIASKIGLTVEEYNTFENGLQESCDVKKLAEAIRGCITYLGCSLEFILGRSYYVYNQDTNQMTQDEYARIIKDEDIVGQRIDSIIFDDDLSEKEIYTWIKEKKLIHSTEDIQIIRRLIRCSKNLDTIKYIAKRLGATWQYIAGLSQNRWCEDIVVHKKQNDIMRNVIANHLNLVVKNYFPRIKYEKLMCERLKSYRQSLGKSFNAEIVAKTLGMSRQAYAKYENGQTSLIDNFHILEKLAEILNCLPEYILLLSDNTAKTGIYAYDGNQYIISCIIEAPLSFYKTYPKPVLRVMSDRFDRLTKEEDSVKEKVIDFIDIIISKKKYDEKVTDVMKMMLEGKMKEN